MKLDFNRGLSTLSITHTERRRTMIYILATKVIYQLYVFLYVF